MGVTSDHRPPSEGGGAHPQIMQMRRGFDAKQAGLAANVSPVVKGRDSLGEIPGGGSGVGEAGHLRSLGNDLLQQYTLSYFHVISLFFHMK